MFSYLRVVVLLGVLAVAGAAAYAEFMLPTLTLPPISHLAERDNEAIAQGYINAVWKKHRDMIAQLVANPTQMKDNPEVPQFAQDSMQYFQGMKLARVNVYASSGALLLTINGSDANMLAINGASPDSAFVKGHMQGALASKQVLEAQTHGGVTLLQTVLPIQLTDGAATEGLLEIIGGATDAPQILMLYQQYATRGVAAVAGAFLVLLFISLLVVASKSEGVITRQHEANQELMQAVAAAQAENRDKSQFLANVSHELRTPLNAIIGFSDILKTDVMAQLPDKKYQNYITDINTAGVHLLSLINDILDFSKAEAGKLELEISEVNVTKLVQNSLRLVSPRAEAGSVALAERLPKDPLIMMTDSKKFKQVLLNLLSNSVKFTPAGGEVSVTAWHDVMGDTFTFEVRDTGIGIAPKDISRAMSPFGQVDNTLRRKYEGTGLGLPLTKKFVELMGGKFTIESEVGKGTKITFTMPRNLQPRDGVIIKQAV